MPPSSSKPKTNHVLREVDTGGKTRFRFEAVCDPTALALCGSLDAHRSTVRGRVVYTVGSVFVSPDHRRQGIATALYQAAAQEACRRRGRLASTARNPNAKSHDFWAKQAARGRVDVIRARGVSDPIYVLPSCPPPPLTGAGRPRRRKRL